MGQFHLCKQTIEIPFFTQGLSICDWNELLQVSMLWFYLNGKF